MQVVLKVVGGKNNGREITISVPEFIIGRGDEAHLKPSSDLVSRKHCAIRIDSGQVIIEDLKSRNGSFVNGSALKGPHIAKTGDTLRVGRLQFEVIVDMAKAGSKKPKVAGVVDAASRTASTSPSNTIEDSISDWLMDEDQEEMDTSARNAISVADTIQLNLEETTAIPKPDSTDDLESDTGEVEEAEVPEAKKKKKKPGKLPPIPKFSHDDSTTAADDVLRKFFNRRP